MKLSKQYKQRLKKRILGFTISVALMTSTLAISKLANFAIPLNNVLSNIINKTATVVLAEEEKEERIKDLASTSKLNNIFIGESEIQGFTPQKLDYELVLVDKLQSININVEKQNENQEVTGIGTVELTGEEQLIEIVVTSEDKTETTTYTILVKYSENTSDEDTYEFSYTGDYKEFIAPYTGYYKIECWGAQGGSYSGTGGKGAYTAGNLYLTKDQKIYVYVGQSGGNLQTSTYNGGGLAGELYNGRSGGGSTDIRLSPGDWNDFESLKSRIMVAAGGGGSMGPSYTCNGGAGGALTGYSGSKGGSGSGYTVAGGGTQTAPGSIGHGTDTRKSIVGGFGYGGAGNLQHGGGGRRRLLWRWPEVAIILAL